MTDTIKIEHGIPIPPKNRRRGNRKYPFDKMNIGDSILLNRHSRASAYYYRLEHPEFHFVLRREEKGLRIWRVSEPENLR
jgi:hypothetical protein